MTLHYFNYVLVINLSFTSMKPSFVYRLLSDILRAGERV